MDERYIMSFTAYEELKDKLESTMIRLKHRHKMLLDNVESYEDDSDLENAKINRIKADQFDIFIKEIESLLK